MNLRGAVGGRGGHNSSWSTQVMKSLERVSFSLLPASALGQVASPAAPQGLRCLLTDPRAPAQEPQVKHSPHRQFQYGLHHVTAMQMEHSETTTNKALPVAFDFWGVDGVGKAGICWRACGTPRILSLPSPLSGHLPLALCVPECAVLPLGSLPTQSPPAHLHSSTPPHTHVFTSATGVDLSWLRCY